VAVDQYQSAYPVTLPLSCRYEHENLRHARNAAYIDGLFNSARDWVMVSILWDRPVSAEEVSAYVEEIKILIDLELN